jgi:heme-degrading monooxygenase HmoA
MAYAIVRFEVEDFTKWRTAFEEAASLRKSYGSRGVRIFRAVDQPTSVVVVADYESPERARQLFQSPEFREATKRAGLAGPPDVVILDEVGQLPA